MLLFFSNVYCELPGYLFSSGITYYWFSECLEFDGIGRRESNKSIASCHVMLYGVHN